MPEVPRGIGRFVDIRRVQFVRVVDPDEDADEVVEDARTRTWTTSLEVALVRSVGGELLLVTGGRDGIEFEVAEAPSGSNVFLCPAGPRVWEIDHIFWHTHPKPTGPSDGDREALRLLGQDRSRIYEFNGEAGGTEFGPDKQHPDRKD